LIKFLEKQYTNLTVSGLEITTTDDNSGSEDTTTSNEETHS
tara:strand:+ start:1277 stop:1399 length:123 start_codon:yes stop_codon:yes gene_type:complete